MVPVNVIPLAVTRTYSPLTADGVSTGYIECRPHPSHTELQNAVATLANPTGFDPASSRESAIRRK